MDLGVLSMSTRMPLPGLGLSNGLRPGLQIPVDGGSLGAP
ncbi:hypothetical protein L083_2203 [Actinoplanes sp. N902-109]|nr:hypothetical protein L083_2203 [Actinoplanes sp. N902-109]